MPASSPDGKIKDTPKSQRTRTRILDAAMRMIAERGYHGASNAEIALAAGLTRGAMLYHFPDRDALAGAVIAHVQQAREALFEAAAKTLPPGGDVSEHAIDVYWALLHEPPFQAFAELEAAARLDLGLRELLVQAQAAFDRAQMGQMLSGLLDAGSSPRLQAARDLARFMLEGLARARLTYDKDARVDRLLTVIKRATHMLNRKGDVHELWED